MIAIVDYGINNLASVRNAIRAVGGEAQVTADAEVIDRAGGIVLPGVGAAPVGMERLRARGLEAVLRDVIARGTPALGICLGMQLLFEWSEEGDVPCLGILPGSTRLLRGAIKVPQIGWNQVRTRRDLRLWAGIPDNPYFYFVHSYICVPREQEAIAGETEYGESFASAVVSNAMWGTQFHPERSGQMGLRLIRNFVLTCEARGKPANHPMETRSNDLLGAV
ncbi:MAG: imidazole glycerol phosphate synthase subunit HisH [Chloroflexota bacterium]|nr:imidazole glycerol phosphate synthase subunit HisH [Chloroflexota bacterium]